MKSLSMMAFGLLAGLVGCSSPPPIQTASSVDLQRFMGDWYVIANIPTFIETGAFNAMESYRLHEDGTIATTFTFREGGFDGKEKTYHPTGFVVDKASNAVWGMQFLWPFKADYRIVFVDDDYRQTIIGRIKRDYVWIMARTPTIPEDEYQGLLDMIAAQGYDITQVQKVPQRWDHTTS
jgi:apolipoprotein D and lipocalin family protein